MNRTDLQPPLPSEVSPVPCDVRPREFSFSRLSGLLDLAGPEAVAEEDHAVHATADPTRVPDTARDEALALGQLVHAVLEVLPFAGAADVSSLVARYADVVLAAKDEPYRQPVVARAEEFISRVASSPRYRALAAARQVAREVDFMLRWPPESPHPPTLSPIPGKGENKVASRINAVDAAHVIRGVVDCMYEDREGVWHIVDYKTNRLAGRALADVARGYELQLRVYAIAMEQIMGASPGELVLWFLDSGEEYTVSWNCALREACLDAVNRAIARLVSSQ